MSFIVYIVIILVSIINLKKDREDPSSVYVTKTRRESTSREIPIEVYRENNTPSPREKTEIIL